MTRRHGPLAFASSTSTSPAGSAHGRQFTTLLLSTTLATYALIATGTAVSSSGSTRTPPILPWEGWIAALSNGSLLVLGHRVAALGTGVLVLATVVVARRSVLDRRVRLALVVVASAFPVQVGLGVLVFTVDVAVLDAIHLSLAMGIFATLLAALAVRLETTTGERHDVPARSVTDDVSEPASEASPSADDGPSKRRSPATGGVLLRARGLARAYLTLTKPRLMWLLCLVAVAGMGLATLTGATFSLATAGGTLVGGVLAIGASATFNHVYERDRDGKMRRTASRPLVHDRVPVRNAVAFGVVLTVGAGAVMVVWVNPLATALTLVALGYYAVGYTVVLKPTTAWNTVVGGGAGALPAVIGWVAVTGSVGLPAVVLAGVVFLWTPAHFYNLAIAYRDDYARGGYPMYPVVAGVAAARRHVVAFLGATLLAATVLGWFAGLGWVYALTSVAFGAVFLRSVVVQYRLGTTAATLRTFYASNYYLGALLCAIVVETLVFAPPV